LPESSVSSIIRKENQDFAGFGLTRLTLKARLVFLVFAYGTDQLRGNWLTFNLPQATQFQLSIHGRGINRTHLPLSETGHSPGVEEGGEGAPVVKLSREGVLTGKLASFGQGGALSRREVEDDAAVFDVYQWHGTLLAMEPIIVLNNTL
jgi:hypothetical protein